MCKLYFGAICENLLFIHIIPSSEPFYIYITQISITLQTYMYTVGQKAV